MHDQVIICLAPRMWASLWRETQALMSRIAADNHVYYFEPGRDPDRPAGAELARNLPHAFRLELRPVAAGLTVIPCPPQLPIARNRLPRRVLSASVPAISHFNALVLRQHVWRVMRQARIEAPILWLSNPYYAGLVGQFGEKLACYYNYDEFSAFNENARISDLVWRYDAALTRAADVVFASSSAQCARRKALNPHTYFVPNAVDFALFNRALEADLPVPDDLAGIPGPRIGFAGWLGHHIDADLLLKIALGYPQCSLVLVGPDELPESAAARALHEAPNVHFLGRKPREGLPNYLRGFDVALMPWSLDSHVKYAYPLKLHEYLAAGKAAVSVALPEVKPFAHVVRIADTHADFVRLVGEALTDDCPEAVQARVQVARENTWDDRIRQIYSLLEPLLAQDKGAVT